MRFRGALQRILKQVLTTNPHIGPVYLSMVDLTDVYMRLWVRMEDVLSVPFLIHNKKSQRHTASGIPHIPPHGVRRQYPYFLMTVDTVSVLTKEAFSQIELVREHLL